MLILPLGDKGYLVQCDASQVRLGCMLMQKGKSDCLYFTTIKEARAQLPYS